MTVVSTAVSLPQFLLGSRWCRRRSSMSSWHPSFVMSVALVLTVLAIAPNAVFAATALGHGRRLTSGQVATPVCSGPDDAGIVTHGPFGPGSTHGSTFDDTPYAAGGLHPITHLEWRSPGMLGSLSVTYQGSDTVGGIRHGVPLEGAIGWANLQPGEAIVAAQVAYSNYLALQYLYSITFTTSQGRQVTAGVASNRLPLTALVASSSPADCGGAADSVLLAIKGTSTDARGVRRVSFVWGPSPLPACPSTSSVFVLGRYGMDPWGAPDYFPDHKASWIWSVQHADTGSITAHAPLPTFTKTFSIGRIMASSAYLHVIADDYVEVLFNGERLGGFSGGYVNLYSPFPDQYQGRPLPVKLRPGRNTLALRCSSGGGSAGVMASLLWANDTTKILARTDASWTYYNNPAATVLGSATMAPWSPINVGKAFPDYGAKWIWSSAAGTNSSAVAEPWVTTSFSRTVSVSSNTSALLHIMADAVADVYVNNVLLGTITGGYAPGTYTDRPLPLTLQGGVGTFLTVRVRNTDGGPAGLLASLVKVADGSVLAHSDATWAVLHENCMDMSGGR